MIFSFVIATNNQVKGDDRYLLEKLNLAKEWEYSQNFKLTNHLLQILKDLYHIKSRKLDDLKILLNIKYLIIMLFLNKIYNRKSINPSNWNFYLQ